MWETQGPEPPKWREREEKERKEEEQRRKNAERTKVRAEKKAEKKKKKPVRYPTEDLDITIGDKEKKAGMQLRKPAPSRAGMPFGRDHITNEGFIMAWKFLVVYG